jgi:polar amino acid transport system substrate-binding protein
MFRTHQLFSFWYLLLLMIFLALLPACGPDSGSVSKKIIIATDATLVPMSFMNDQNKIDGFDRALMEAIAKEAGLEIEMVNVEWAGLLGGLTTGKYDAAISSITILEERKQKMAFSTPYLKSGLAIVVRKETQGVATMDDLLKQNMMVGAQRGTTAYFLLKDHPAIRNMGYESYGHAVQDLIKGELDAVLGESTGTLYYKNKDKPVFDKIKMVGEILTNEYYGIAVRKDNPALLQSLDKALKTLLTNGTVKQLHKKWDLGQAAVIPSPSEKPPTG